jgi:biotin transport system substrate-specific component
MAALPAAAPSQRHVVLADTLPDVRLRNAALVLAGALLTALLAQIEFMVPPSPVPVTGQTLAVGLAGATLGARRGSSSMALYVALGLVLPVYSGGSSGWDVLWGPTGGYLVGFIVAAGVIGRLAEYGADRRIVAAFAAFILGQSVIFGFGLAGLKLAVGESWSWTIHNGFTIFIVGGLMKAGAGAALLPGAWRLVRRVEPRD